MSLHDIWRGDVMPLSGVAVAIGRNSFDPPAPVVPCFDVHIRELDLHDSNDPISDPPEREAGSGILMFDAERNHLILNPSTSGAAAVCTAVYFDIYNTANTGLSNLTGGGSVVVMSTVRSTAGAQYFTLASNVTHVWASGTYEITMRSSCDEAGTFGRLTVRAWLERASAGGSFVEVPGTRHWMYSRRSANGEDSALCTIVLQGVAPGDRFRCKMSQESTGMIFFGPVALALGCGLTFEKLE